MYDFVEIFVYFHLTLVGFHYKPANLISSILADHNAPGHDRIKRGGRGGIIVYFFVLNIPKIVDNPLRTQVSIYTRASLTICFFRRKCMFR